MLGLKRLFRVSLISYYNVRRQHLQQDLLLYVCWFLLRFSFTSSKGRHYESNLAKLLWPICFEKCFWVLLLFLFRLPPTVQRTPFGGFNTCLPSNELVAGPGCSPDPPATSLGDKRWIEREVKQIGTHDRPRFIKLTSASVVVWHADTLLDARVDTMSWNPSPTGRWKGEGLALGSVSLKPDASLFSSS